MENQQIANCLNELIEVSKDGERGFVTCAEGAKDAQLKAYFEQCARRCGDAARVLGVEVARLGGKPGTSGSASAALHRAWLNVKTAVTSNDDLAVLEECERGEDVAIKAYAKCLQENLPPNVRTIVQSQYQGVVHNHDKVKMLRDERRRKSA
ncbi:PA2169 family four-helix-bundle protein [Usitatibacter palustris]|uniref:DUF2383 domain-containing protein n=1 Tax=Usitatibacter palustris TaxID=2732487 RepID=A0A6M4H677_9PROT|nr:PA2169 family four-helix-bundle protein [Usitatibacter palustris]QJR15136.1 hypothetical protein DSM104440_01953 [Usitatibacter palustris]